MKYKPDKIKYIYKEIIINMNLRNLISDVENRYIEISHVCGYWVINTPAENSYPSV